MGDYDWLTDKEERELMERTVHALRSQGWSRIEAVDEAINRVLDLRDKRKAA